MAAKADLSPPATLGPAELAPRRAARSGRRTAAQKRASDSRREAEFNRAVTDRVQQMLPDAIAGKIQELMPALVDQLTAARTTAGTVVENAGDKTGDHALLEGLAHAMAKASDPGNKRRIVDPSKMRMRAEAAKRMRDLLIDYHAQGRMPLYRVVAKTHLANILIEPEFQNEVTKRMEDQTINWPRIPNQALEPINDEAKAVFKEFLQSIDAVPRDMSQDLASFVLSGSQVLRGRDGGQRAQVGNQMGGIVPNDPRRTNPGGKEPPKTLAILGSIHEPAVLNQ